MKPDEKAISDKDAGAIVLAIKAGSIEYGIKVIQTIAEVSQDKVIAYVSESLLDKKL